MEKYTILVVDDNTKYLENAKEAVEKLGFNFISASSTKEATEMIEELSKSEDLYMVLTDLNMETKDAGNEVMKECADKMIPVVMVTGGFDHEIPVLYIRCP